MEFRWRLGSWEGHTSRKTNDRHTTNERRFIRGRYSTPSPGLLGASQYPNSASRSSQTKRQTMQTNHIPYFVLGSSILPISISSPLPCPLLPPRPPNEMGCSSLYLHPHMPSPMASALETPIAPHHIALRGRKPV